METIVTVKGKTSKSVSDLKLLCRVDIILFITFHEVIRNSDSAVRNDFRSFVLRLAQQRSCAHSRLRLVTVRSDLNHIERKFRLSIVPALSPMRNHVAHTLDELLVETYVRASLIPDESLDRVTLYRIEHCVVCKVWSVVMDKRLHVCRIEILVRISLKNLLRSPALDTGSAVGA